MEWRSIEGHKHYEISDSGLCRNVLNGKVLKPIPYNKGYLKYALYDNTVRRCYFAHRLVAKAFIPNNENHPVVNHIDGDPANNCVNNLEWCTISHNAKYAYKIGRHSHRGNRNPSAKLDNVQVMTIRSLFKYDKSKAFRKAVADYFGMSLSATTKVMRGYTWKSLAVN